MNVAVSINYTAVVVAGLAAWVLGWLWYSVLFQKPWLKLMGVTPEMMAANKGKGMMKMMVFGALSAIVTAWVLSYDIAIWHAVDAMTALQVTFWLWLGYIATTQLDGVLYEKKPLKLYAINTGYRFCALLVSALVLALWK